MASPLNALLLSDGRPGHFNLSLGVLAALARKRAVVTHRLEVRRPKFVPARMLSFMINAGMEPIKILQSVYGLGPDRLPEADLVVSAGGNTLAANIAASNLLGAPNIFYGSLRRFQATDFALVLSSYPENDVHPNHVTTLKPSAFDPEELGRSAYSYGGAPRVAGLILGGDAGTVRFANKDWSQLFAFAQAVHRRDGTRWIVANGPRTPDTVSDRVAALAQDNDSGVSEFVDFRQAGAGSLQRVLGQVEAVVCTADSSSMLSESIWARRAVLSVSPKRFGLPEAEYAYRNWLAAQGWLRSVPIANLEVDEFASHLLDVTPMTDNPLDALADTLVQRLPQVA